MLELFSLCAKLRSVLALSALIVAQPTTVLAEAAIAFGQWDSGWAAGISSDKRTQADAQTGAMNECNSRGYNCGIRLNFFNSCGALAVQVGGNGYAVASRPDEYSARQSALATCVRMGLACEIKTARCDSVSEAVIRAQEEAEAQRQYQTFLSNWRGCFSGAVASCDNALGYPNLSSQDRSRLNNQRAAITEAEERRREQEYQTFLLNWRTCFSGAMASCNNALAYPNLSSSDRSRLINQRAAITAASEPKPAPPYVEKFPPTSTNASEGPRWEQVTSDITAVRAMAAKYLPDARGQLLAALLVLAIARIAKATLKSKSDKTNLWRDVRIEAFASLLTAPVLMYIGAEKDLTAISIPVGLGFSVALLWSLAQDS